VAERLPVRETPPAATNQYARRVASLLRKSAGLALPSVDGKALLIQRQIARATGPSTLLNATSNINPAKRPSRAPTTGLRVYDVASLTFYYPDPVNTGFH
jgi:hypothetical protein